MKACLYIGPGSNEWCWRFFPKKNPGELPVAGKSWCRHMIDQCSRLHVDEVCIADCYFRDELIRQLGSGDYWSLKLHALPTVPCAFPDQLLMQHPQLLSPGKTCC